MTTDKSSSMQADRNEVEAQDASDPAELSNDLSRIADYLDTQRQSSRSRTAGLIDDIANGRPEIIERLGLGQSPRLQQSLQDLTPVVRRTAKPKRSTNPAFNERYHAFCRDIDALMDSFKARIEQRQRTRH